MLTRAFLLLTFPLLLHRLCHVSLAASVMTWRLVSLWMWELLDSSASTQRFYRIYLLCLRRCLRLLLSRSECTVEAQP
ncbi:unnamed protein product [Brassica napus]|uniref:(rape) hypothetical protein n=1 Tax=Brassica napus TaxID=3708 RepID=A0A816IID8_BRANA|nr:unnamed protein product [Brassica napus]